MALQSLAQRTPAYAGAESVPCTLDCFVGGACHRKLKGHALLERDGSRYAYRLTAKGVEVALLFLLFHKRLCGPLADSRFHHRPDPRHRPDSRLEAADYRADKAIEPHRRSTRRRLTAPLDNPGVVLSMIVLVRI